MSSDVFQARSYGAREIGFGRKPGIVVVDYQLAFTDKRFPLGGAPLIEPDGLVKKHAGKDQWHAHQRRQVW